MQGSNSMMMSNVILIECVKKMRGRKPSFWVCFPGTISEKFLTTILRICDKNFEQLHCRWCWPVLREKRRRERRKMNYRDHRITCDRSTCHGINESDGRSGYQLVSKLSDRRNEIFGIKSWMDPWNFRIVFRNVSVRDSYHCSWRSPWDDLYDRCNDELSEYEERYDCVCCVDHYIGRNIHIIFCFERVCFIITDQQWRFYNQFFK